ncbi:MAG: toxin-antitoxin system YwqK family antitoxin [Saprospiraceae bacterium]|nr:toxin-antitoxin system YwqK family antitoxin [Saprospiraceae bacterium]
MQTRSSLLGGLLLMALLACNKEKTQELPAEWKAYQLEELKTVSGAQRAVKLDSNGKIVEEGVIVNGRKSGAWLHYEGLNSNFPTRIETYVDGVQNGPYLELGPNGQIKLKAFYKDDMLHGNWTQYSFSRPLIDANYQDGKLHGVYREFELRDGKIKKEINYKNGKLDGPYRFYNPEGKITLEYLYNNGEQVSGAIMDTTNTNAPR